MNTDSIMLLRQVWFAGTWVNWLGHSGAIDAGHAVASRLGANYPLQNKVSRDELFRACCTLLTGSVQGISSGLIYRVSVQLSKTTMIKRIRKD